MKSKIKFYPPKKNKTGFTLVEIVIAAVILALAISGLWASYMTSKRYSVYSKNRMVSVNAGRYILEDFRNNLNLNDWSSASEFSPGYEGTYAGLPAGHPFAQMSGAVASYRVYSVAGCDCRKVELILSWPAVE